MGDNRSKYHPTLPFPHNRPGPHADMVFCMKKSGAVMDQGLYFVKRLSFLLANKRISFIFAITPVVWLYPLV